MNSTLVSVSDVKRDPAYLQIKNCIIDYTGLVYYADKDDMLADRVLKRCLATQVTDGRAYLELLESPQGQAELDALAVELTVGETYFFRHEAHFKALRDVILPDLLQRKQHQCQLRIWSAGCATGAEAYSISILLKRNFGDALVGWQISILGTDINRCFLAQAIEGRYEEWALRGVPPDMREYCFTREKSSWKVKSEFKKEVSFEYHNLIKNPFPSLLQNLAAFDLILCRNAMIYFSRDVNIRLAQQFHQTLVDGGWLLVGYAEADRELFRPFQIMEAADATLFRKSLSQTSVAFSKSLPPVFDTPPPKRSVPVTAKASVSLDDVIRLADRGDWENALRLCESLRSSERLNPRLHFILALVHEQMGHLSEAEQVLRQALYLDRSHAQIHYHLGLLLARGGEKKQAAKSFENTLALLQPLPLSQVLIDSDGLSVGELGDLARMQIDILRGEPA